MTAPQSTSTPDVWMEEGRRASAVVDAIGSAVVVGRDAEAAAYVALGIARAQAERRRVAVADLVGELAPLQALVDPEGDPHGISDSFLYGVSLNKIAHQADASGNLFVLPSGSEAVAIAEVFESDRWRRLASGFREVGALLLLVAQADTPGLDALAASVDGVIIAGDAAGALADAPPPLAVVAPVRRRAGRASAESAAVAPSDAWARARRPLPPDQPLAPPADAPPARWKYWLGLAVLATMLAGTLIFWVFPRRTSVDGDVLRRGDGAPATNGRASPGTPAAPAPAGTTSADSTARAPGALAPLTVANPADSASAVPYSVYVSASNTPDGAALDARTAATISVLALTPELQDGAPVYRMLVGAYPTRGEADSALVALRGLGVLGDESGRVVRAPYALLVADRVPAADAPSRVRALAQKNVPVYALSRGDGTVALYAGAFERPEQAAWLDRALRDAGVPPTLVYRTGRSL